MGLIFKTPSDDAVEGTLRQLYIANQVDRAYERTFGWLKVLLFSVLAMFVTSAFEYYGNESIWEGTLTRTYDYIVGLF